MPLAKSELGRIRSWNEGGFERGYARGPHIILWLFAGTFASSLGATNAASEPRSEERRVGSEKRSYLFYQPSQKTMGVSLWMKAQGGPSEARRAKERASADCAEEMKDTTGVSPWRLHSKKREPVSNFFRLIS